jgi:hypothetical protein
MIDQHFLRNVFTIQMHQVQLSHRKPSLMNQQFTMWNQSGRKFGQPGQLNFAGPNGTKSITLQQYNRLYFISSASYSIVDESMPIEDEAINSTPPSCEGPRFESPEKFRSEILVPGHLPGFLVPESPESFC